MKKLTEEQIDIIKSSELKYKDIINLFKSKFNYNLPKSLISYHKTKGMTREQIKNRHSQLSSTSGANFRRVEIHPSFKLKIDRMCQRYSKKKNYLKLKKKSEIILRGYTQEKVHFTLASGRINILCFVVKS